LRRASILLAVLLWTASAAGQTDPGGSQADPAGAPTDPAGARADPSGDPNDWLRRDQLTGDWRGVRPFLSARGFEPYLTYTGAMWSNFGGRADGTEFIGYLDSGVELDLEKIAGWPGGGFHADFHWYAGRQPSVDLVGLPPAMAIDGWEASNAFRVYNLYLHQELADRRLVVHVGQIAADTNFMTSHYAGLFVNAAFGDIPTENIDTDTPVYPLAAPGVYAHAKLSPSLDWKVGAYTANAGRDVAGNHGFEWKLGNQVGYGIYSELGVEPAPAGLPGRYVVGGYYIAADVPLLTGDGSRYGNYSVWVMADQAVVVDGGGKPAVGIFARFSACPQKDRNPAFLYADAGVNFVGPIPSRPTDVFGLAFGILKPSDAVPAPALLPEGQEVLELTYQAQLTPWLTVQPDAQFLPNPIFSDRDAFAIGLRAVAVF